MDLIRASIEKPVAVAVGVILIVLFGILALTAIPIQLTPNVDQPVITVSTFWEGASPQEIERDIIEKQEEKLKGVTNLRKMTSSSEYSSGTITLEFRVGTDIDFAFQEVSAKLREVSEYPDNVEEPVITEGDPNNRDYIAWIIFETTDPDFDVRTLFDFAEDDLKPVIERVPGVSEVNVLGGWEKEVQVRLDPIRMAQRGVTYGQLVDALRRENVNVSAGTALEGKSSVSVRTIGRYDSMEDIEQTIITQTDGGPIRVADVADAVMVHKEPFSFVRSRGQTVMAINAQREPGSNVMEVMEGLDAELARLNGPGGLLEQQALKLGLDGKLYLRKVYDQTIYIRQAIDLVTGNIYVGGTLAVVTLLLFLRSLKSVGIIALAIPISVIGTFVVMVGLGRNLNVISLAGLAFAVGMVVDNAIVVLENIFRHLENGERPTDAAYLATKEVWGGVLGSTLTTAVVFIPVLFVEEEAGQLFRDIALAICASVLLSLVVSITVVPTAARWWLGPRARTKEASIPVHELHRRTGLSGWLARAIYFLSGSVLARLAVVALFAVTSIVGTIVMIPPSDYLPTGNRNLVFGMMIPPPGYNLDMLEELNRRVEAEVRPFWEASDLKDDPEAYERALAQLPKIPLPDGSMVTPPSIENYFFVGLNSGIMFHGGVSDDDKRVVDLQAFMNHVTRPDNLPGVIGFAFQAPLFQLGGGSGSSIEIEFVGDRLEEVVASAEPMFMAIAQKYGFHTVTPVPGNFNLPGPELQLDINRVRAADLGLSTRDVGFAAQTLGSGAVVGEFRDEGESIDIKLLDRNAVDEQGFLINRDLFSLADVPIATPTGHTVPLATVANFVRTTAPRQINRVEERRAVSLEFTPPKNMALESAMAEINQMIQGMRDQGVIPPTVATNLAGSADKLTAVRTAMLGDGTVVGLLKSRMFLALLVVYLLMCVLFESFLYPAVILLSVPLATFGGFIGLALVHAWSVSDRYMPQQNLDVLTMLGFVILIGVVVNNAILLVHQALNFMRGIGESEEDRIEALPPRLAIAESARTRLRPIMMTTLTSVGGMMPLVLMPGAGSELYRGLGSVMVGGLLLSTLFTLVLVPLLFSLVIDARQRLFRKPAVQPMSLDEVDAPARPAAAPAPTRATPPQPAGTGVRRSPD